jgi:hypothetical protein
MSISKQGDVTNRPLAFIVAIVSPDGQHWGIAGPQQGGYSEISAPRPGALYQRRVPEAGFEGGW